MIGIGIGIPYNKVLGGLSAEALAWEARIIANSGTIPAATLAIFDQYFFIPAKANGNILSELDRLNIYCGLVGYEIAARTNIIKSAHYVTPVSSPTFDNNGYKSGGTSYLDLNYNPNTQGVKYTLNSAILGYVVKNPTYASQYRSIGSHDGVGVRADIQRAPSGNSAFINSSVGINDTNKPTGNVFSCVLRSGAVNGTLVTNTTLTTSADASVSIPNFNQYELCLNFGGSPLGPFDILYHYCSFAGSGSLDYAALRVILNNLFTALGL